VVAATVILAGQVSENGERTVTVKLQVAVLPQTSLTEQFTVVVPIGKVLPLGGLHTGVP
jgi:hypothetical protein